jgi:tetratricopeptide (TPR) repeat protein
MRPAFVALVVVLGLLSWRQSHLYGGDAISLYRETLKRNPDAWIFHQNWGEALQLQGDREGALEHYLAALAIRPDLADIQFGAGQMYYELGRQREAAAAFAEGVRLWPRYAKGRFNYGAALAGIGERERAIAQFDTAAALEADSALMQEKVANAYLSLGDTARAMAAVQRLLRLRGGQ